MSERSPYLLTQRDAALVVVDIQEKFAPHVHAMDALVERAVILGRTAQALEIPTLVTEQYRRGLGLTLPAITESLPAHTCLEKTAFSSYRAEGFADALAATGRKSVVLTGIETHVCVLQTGLDLLAAGYQIWVPADAVGSRAPENKALGIQLLERAGAVIGSTEMLLFMLLEDARHPKFREVQALVK